MKKKEKRNFWSDGLSINETRFSVLVVMTLSGFGYALFSHYSKGDITENLLELVRVLILSIVGVNVANSVSDSFRTKRDDNTQHTYNDSAGRDEDYFDPSQKK